MAGLRDERRQIAARPEENLRAARVGLGGLLPRAGRADEAPALRAKATGEGAGAVAMPEGEERSGHDAGMGEIRDIWKSGSCGEA